jgi:predicted RNA-binding Zn ribbon-like protein
MTISGVEGLATGRLHLPGGRAPGGLCLVQELVNTSLSEPQASPRLADLLADADAAASWLSRALEQWADATRQPVPQISLSPGDLAPLRQVREGVRALAARTGRDEAGPAGLSGAQLTLGIGPDGRLTYRSSAAGWRGVAALIAAEILLAQQRGEWARFKTCPVAACGVAFYDESRNASRVWHDVKTCGNQANLRAYRARLKEANMPYA